MYREMDGPTLLKTCADNAQTWAKAFMEIVISGSVRIDEGLMIGWFANAIETSNDVRRWRAMNDKDGAREAGRPMKVYNGQCRRRPEWGYEERLDGSWRVFDQNDDAQCFFDNEADALAYVLQHNQ